MKFLGLELAPLSIPLERRLQTYAVFHHVSSFIYFGIASVWFMIILLCTPFCWLSLLYLTWYIIDFNQSSRGGRQFEWMRRAKMWNWYRDYFPVRMIATAQLDPERCYVFGSHPHGVMGLGVFCNFVTEATGFSKVFPGITMHLLSLKLMHYFPLYREYIMGLGICDVSKESIRYLMRKKGTAVSILVGGAKESLDAVPGSKVTRIVLKNRKGFIKIAIQNGAYVVPTFTFGENELYKQAMDNPPGSKVREWQRYLQLKWGVAPILFFGRGVFNYTLGVMPKRLPLTTVVGNSIPVDKEPSPPQEYIDEIHSRYMRELKSLFDTYKAECGYPDEEIEFID